MLSAAVGLVGCSSAATIGDLPPNKKLVDLDPDEKQSVCEWSTQIANMKLPKTGSQVTCHGLPAVFNRPSECMFPKVAQEGCVDALGGSVCPTVAQGCSATVSQYRACIPNFIDRIAADPCLGTGSYSAFVEQVSGCRGLGPCGFH